MFIFKGRFIFYYVYVIVLHFVGLLKQDAKLLFVFNKQSGMFQTLYLKRRRTNNCCFLYLICLLKSVLTYVSIRRVFAI